MLNSLIGKHNSKPIKGRKNNDNFSEDSLIKIKEKEKKNGMNILKVRKIAKPQTIRNHLQLKIHNKSKSLLKRMNLRNKINFLIFKRATQKRVTISLQIMMK